MGLKKKISYEICLNDNDWNEIKKALPKLAQRQIVTGDNLFKTFNNLLCHDEFLDFLENRFGLSLVKDIREYLKNNEEELEDIPGLASTIGEIDDKVMSYIDCGNAELKASFFDNEEEFEDWLNNFDRCDIASKLWDAIQNDPDNPILDKIISGLEEYR